MLERYLVTRTKISKGQLDQVRENDKDANCETDSILALQSLSNIFYCIVIYCGDGRLGCVPSEWKTV